MKNNYNCFNWVFHSCIPVSSKLTSFLEMDCLSRTLCLCFLTVMTVQVFGSKIPSFSGTRFFRLDKFARNGQRQISSTSVECAIKCPFPQSGIINETAMGKKKNTSSEASPQKKLKLEHTEENLFENKRKRPNYFVAVQISNPNIHEMIQRIQDHIIAQNSQLNACMNSIPTLHITLMVMSITDSETHNRALKALQNVHKEFNDEMYKKPLRLEFCGLGHFKNRVLYAKIKEEEPFKRLCGLAESVKKHFAEFEIFSTDQREFNPHLTIAKIDFSKKKCKRLKKIEPSMYETFINEYIGCETIAGIQLLKMTGPKTETGYYSGETIIFESNNSGSSREARLADLKEQKREIRTKIANLAQKIFK